MFKINECCFKEKSYNKMYTLFFKLNEEGVSFSGFSHWFKYCFWQWKEFFLFIAFIFAKKQNYSEAKRGSGKC